MEKSEKKISNKTILIVERAQSIIIHVFRLQMPELSQRWEFCKCHKCHKWYTNAVNAIDPSNEVDNEWISFTLRYVFLIDESEPYWRFELQRLDLHFRHYASDISHQILDVLNEITLLSIWFWKKWRRTAWYWFAWTYWTVFLFNWSTTNALQKSQHHQRRITLIRSMRISKFINEH